MAFDDGWRHDDDDEVEALDETNYKSQRDAVIIAIDVSYTMLEKPIPKPKKSDKDTALMATLKCASHLMEQRIISNPKDMMGILFFGTEKARYLDEEGRPSQAYPNCYVYVDLDIPAAEDVRAVKELIESDEEQVLVPSREKTAMANVLFCANQIFTTKAPNFTSRRLFIITDNDNPHPDDKQAKSAAAVRAKDLYDLGVIIELFPITRGDTKFQMSNFYDDIIYHYSSLEANNTEVLTSKSGDGLTLLMSLISNVTSKQAAKRALFSGVPFEIAPGLTVTVSGYNVLAPQKPTRSCYIWLDGEKPQLVKGETATLAQDTAETVEKADKKKAYKFGGDYVYFTPEELKELRNFGTPVIRILGFKPRSSIRLWESVKRATFIFPNETHYVGSTRVFASLWKKLLKDNKVGIVWATTRSNARPSVCALIPTVEKVNEKTETPYLPAGMWLYPLPFADDIRNGPEDYAKIEPSEQMIDEMTELIENLWLPSRRYDPSRYPNPSLQWHYRILQALALGDDMPENPVDATIPKFEAIRNRVGNVMKEVNKLANAEAEAAFGKTSGKRELDADDDGPRKRVRTPVDGDVKLSDKQLKSAVEDNSVQKMTVTQLKDVLTIRGIAPQGKKADLIGKLEQWLERQ